MCPPLKHLFLINPRAGKYDRSREILDKLHWHLDSRPLEWEAVVTQGPDHARQLAAQAAGTGDAVRIYACGGDGTLNEAAVGAAG
jgi:diacylglycerol kinase (ATP)